MARRAVVGAAGGRVELTPLRPWVESPGFTAPSRLLPVVVLVAGLGVLGTVGLTTGRRHVERSLGSRAADALSGAGVRAEVRMEGRDVTVYVPATVADAKVRRILERASIDGLRSVAVVHPGKVPSGLSVSPALGTVTTVRRAVAATAPVTAAPTSAAPIRGVRATVSQDGVAFSGTVPDESVIQRLTAAAAEVVGPKNVDVQLDLDPVAGSDPQLIDSVAVMALYLRQIGATSGEVTLDGGLITLRGELPSPAARMAAVLRAGQLVGGPMRVVNLLTVAPAA